MHHETCCFHMRLSRFCTVREQTSEACAHMRMHTYACTTAFIDPQTGGRMGGWTNRRWMNGCAYACTYSYAPLLDVGMYACVCTYVCTYLHTNVCKWLCKYTYATVCVSMYVCMYVCMHACMHVCTYICVYRCVCVYLYGRLHACLEATLGGMYGKKASKHAGR